MKSAPRALALALALSVTSAGSFAGAQALPAGVAGSINEAPGAPLAVPSGMSATLTLQGAAPPSASGAPAAADPLSQRSMAFTSGEGPQCRDTVPGGTLLALAYAAVLALLGAYTVLLAVKNVKLAAAVRDLEREVIKRTPITDAERDEQAPG